MRIASPGHAVFAVAMIALGIIGLITGGFVGVWGGVPESMPSREALAYIGAVVALASGVGLLWQVTSTFAARILFLYLLLWLIAFKVPFIVRASLVEGSYQTTGETAAIVAGAWVLYAWLAPDWDRRRLNVATGDSGVRLARILYALALVAFGLSHFVYVELTAPLVPSWLGWPVGWAYFTGAAYLAAGAAILTGVLARLAAALTVVQMASFTLLIWVPLAASGPVSNFRFGEIVVNCVLTASAWVVADSYRGTPWFAMLDRKYSDDAQSDADRVT